jgi:hypothetical protein
MNNHEATSVAAKYFPNYPDVSTFHVTEDGQVFQVSNDAINHAIFLLNKNNSKGEPVVITITREDATEVLKEVENPALITLQEAIDTAKSNVESKRAAFDAATEDKKKDALASLEASEEALTEAEHAYTEALNKA